MDLTYHLTREDHLAGPQACARPRCVSCERTAELEGSHGPICTGVMAADGDRAGPVLQKSRHRRARIRGRLPRICLGLVEHAAVRMVLAEAILDQLVPERQRVAR